MIYLAEGFATAASSVFSNAEPCRCLFNADNLVRVAQIFKGKYTANALLFAVTMTSGTKKSNGDPSNPGRGKEERAAKQILDQQFPKFKDLSNNPWTLTICIAWRVFQGVQLNNFLKTLMPLLKIRKMEMIKRKPRSNLRQRQS